MNKNYSKNKISKRKPTRLREFDYISNGAYFVTICTKNKKMLFDLSNENSIANKMIENSFITVLNQYENVDSPIFVVMPNHFHAIITITKADKESAPTISNIVQEFKRLSTINYIKMVKNGLLPEFDKSIWQRSFHDHIIRNNQDYNEIYKYVSENPMRWEFDSLYVN